MVLTGEAKTQYQRDYMRRRRARPGAVVRPYPVHGGYLSREYAIWLAMKGRCTNPKEQSYKYYGARFISVCERWRDSFENFLADMGPRPSSKHSIDRYPDNNGNYEPGNCRWATAKEQRANQRPRVHSSDLSHPFAFTADEIAAMQRAMRD
jgi:hypothetical protein